MLCIINIPNGGDIMITMATATEMQNNFGRYLSLIMAGQEVIVTRNGHEVGRLIPKEATVSFLTDSLTGILRDDGKLDEARTEELKDKYGFVD
jgi:prevent-host-death family protein